MIVLLFFKLLIGHALADYALQPMVMIIGKNRHRSMEGVPWYYWMTAHALINSGAVWFITQSLWFGLAELILHWMIDFVKCEKWINAITDQWLHVACKLAYVL